MIQPAEYYTGDMFTPVRSVTHAFAIMRALAARDEMTLSEVAQRCEISPSSCLGLLRTLVDEGVVRRETGKRYALSPAWSGMPVVRDDITARIVAHAPPRLARLARDLSAPVGLWRIVSRDRLQLVALGESTAATRIHMAEGQRQPIGSGALGRAFAATQEVPADEIRRRYERVRWQRPVDPAGYVAQIAAAKRDGYAVDDGLMHAGVTSVAVTVPGSPSTLGLSASVFAGSKDECELAAIAAALTRLAAELAASGGGEDG
jgi:DNA-binding IclR family transcriptional regulator